MIIARVLRIHAGQRIGNQEIEILDCAVLESVLLRDVSRDVFQGNRPMSHDGGGLDGIESKPCLCSRLQEVLKYFDELIILAPRKPQIPSNISKAYHVYGHLGAQGG